MLHCAAQRPECGQRLALAEQYPDIVAARRGAGIVKNCEVGRIGNEGIGPQLIAGDACALEYAIQANTELGQHGRQQHQ